MHLNRTCCLNSLPNTVSPEISICILFSYVRLIVLRSKPIKFYAILCMKCHHGLCAKISCIRKTVCHKRMKYITYEYFWIYSTAIPEELTRKNTTAESSPELMGYLISLVAMGKETTVFCRPS